MSSDGNPFTRRVFLAGLVLGLIAVQAPEAMAKDDGGGSNSGSGGGDDGGGNDDGGNDDGGGDDGGSDDGGNDDSGHDDDRDDNDRDDGKDDDRDDDKNDSKKIREAVKSGEAIPLKQILAEVRRKYPGQVVNVRLTGSGNKLTYRIRILDATDRLIEVRVNARTKRMTLVKGLY